jgi:hypothetical protein
VGIAVLAAQLAAPTETAGRVATSGPAASAAAPQPVPRPADRSSPRLALKSLMVAMIEGTDHGEGWIAESDLERAAAESVSDMVHEADRLRLAAMDRFGAPIGVPLAVNLPRPEQLDEAMEIPIDDHHATIDAGSGTAAVIMMEIDNEWRLPLDGLPPVAGFDSVEAMRDECERLFEGFRSLRSEVNNGQINSAAELQAALKELVESRP